MVQKPAKGLKPEVEILATAVCLRTFTYDVPLWIKVYGEIIVECSEPCLAGGFISFELNVQCFRFG